LQVKVHHRYLQHRQEICHWYQITPAANFATSTAGVVDTGGKFSMVANNGNNIRLLTTCSELGGAP
jgi:hypothetical protein